MPGFKFNLSQPVAVPEQPGIQGRILQQIQTAGGGREYRVAWLDDLGILTTNIFREEFLIGAQVLPAADPALLATFNAMSRAPAKPAKRSKRR